MDYEKNSKYNSTTLKLFALALVIVCAVAFMPLLNGAAFAAEKKPGKVKGLKLKQADQMETAGKYRVTIQWTKLKSDVTKYRIQIMDMTSDGATAKVQNKTRTKSKASFEGDIGNTYRVKMQALNGKRKGCWTDPKEITIVDKRIPLTSVSIKSTSKITPRTSLTTTLDPAEAVTEWQWYRVKNDIETPIEGATKSAYVVQNADVGSYLKVVAKAGDDNLIYCGTVEDMTKVSVTGSSGGGGTIEPTDILR